MQNDANHHSAQDGRILVTGGAGFIGSHVVRRLVQQGWPVRVLELPDVAVGHLPSTVQVVRGDVRRLDALRKAMRGCKTVIHLAANPNLYVVDPAEHEAVNHEGTRHALRAAAEAELERFVHISTESIIASSDGQVCNEDTMLPLAQMYGSYLRSKWLAEQAVSEAMAQGQPALIVRPSVPVGPGNRKPGPLSRLICAFARGQIVAYLPGTVDLIDVRDLADGIVAATLRGQMGARYLLHGHTLDYQDFFTLLAQLLGRRPPRWQVPYGVALACAYVEEAWCRHLSGGTPLATVAGVKLTRRSFQFDGSRTRAELGLRVRPCLQSLRDAIAWFGRYGLIDVGRPAPALPVSPAAESIAPDSQHGG